MNPNFNYLVYKCSPLALFLNQYNKFRSLVPRLCLCKKVNIILLSVPRNPKSCRSLKFPEHCYDETAPSVARPPHYRGFMITRNDASQSVGLLSTSDQLLAETSNWQHTTLTIDRHPCPARFEPAIPESEQPQTYALGCAAIGTG